VRRVGARLPDRVGHPDPARRRSASRLGDRALIPQDASGEASTAGGGLWGFPAPAADRAATVLVVAHLLVAWAITLSGFLLAAAVVAFAIGRWLSPQPLSASFRPPMRLAVAYLVLLLAAILASPDWSASWRSASEIFNFTTLALVLVLIRGERAVRWLVDALILSGGAIAAAGLAQIALGFGDLERRIRGPFSHYMTFAGFLLLLDLMLVARLLERRRRDAATGPTAWLDRLPLAWIVLALINTALFASLTRNAWVALVLALTVLVALARPRRMVLAPVVVWVFLIVAPVPVVARALSIADLTDSSSYDRICMVQAGLRMVGERPLLGVGPDQVKRIYPLYRHPTAPRLLIPHLHNSYLQLAAERGIPALAVMMGLLGGTAVVAARGFRRRGRDADLHLGVLGALVAFGIAALFENNWGDTEVQRLLLGLIALPYALAASEESR
jgi:O-antigen ligase